MTEPVNYSHMSHTHCWEQTQPSACGIPLEKHTQCCLCDMKYEPEKSEWRKELSDLWEEFPLKEELLDKVGTLLRTHFIPKEQVRSELNRLDTEVLPTHAEEMRDSIKEVSHDAFELGIRTERNRILRALIDIDFPPGMWGRISYIIAPTSPTETEV